MGNTLLGVAIMLVSTSVMNVGSVLQKKAVDRLPPLEGQPLLASIRSVLRTPLWLFGWVMTSGAIVLNWVALGFADISIVQPLNGFGLVVLAVFSRFYLGERLTPPTLLGIGGVVVGLAIIGATASESRSWDDAAAVLESYTRPAAIATLAGLLLLILGLWAVASRVARFAGVLFAFIAAASSVLGLTFSKGLFACFAIAGLGATLSTWPAYLLAGLLLGFSTLAIMLQQLSFQKGRAVVVTPIFGAASVALPLATGLLVFREAVSPATLVAVLFVVVGVAFLGTSGAGEAPRDAEAAEPIAEAEDR